MKHRFPREKCALGGLMLLCLAGGAQAANCTLSVTDISFGAVTQLNPSPVDVQGSLTVQCQAEAADLEGVPPTATVDYLLQMNGGTTTNNPAARGMQGPGEVLSYQVYSDSGRQFPWGDGSNGTQPVAGQMVFTAADVLAGTQKSADHISYARLPANINVAPGLYTDTVTVRLSF